MALEIEIKAYCRDLALVAAKVLEAGGEFVRRERMTDIYFNHPARDFAQTDEALRIRSLDGQTRLTYKGPKIGTRAKTREEHELEVSDFGTLRSILGSLGFRESGSVEKVRDIYGLAGTEVCLDRVTGLGDFVELERTGEDREAIEGELFDLAARLGLDRFERRSYLELLFFAD